MCVKSVTTTHIAHVPVNHNREYGLVDALVCGHKARGSDTGACPNIKYSLPHKLVTNTIRGKRRGD